MGNYLVQVGWAQTQGSSPPLELGDDGGERFARREFDATHFAVVAMRSAQHGHALV